MKERKTVGFERQAALAPHTLCAGSTFNRYKQLPENKIRALDIEEDKIGQKIVGMWNAFNTDEDRGYWSLSDRNAHARQLVSRLGMVCSDDVTRFCVALTEFQDMKEFPVRAGVFLTALAYYCPEEQCIIMTRHLSKAVAYLGSELTN
jgi:hypothetical protein